MTKAEFSYNDSNYIIQCKNDDKMKDIIGKFLENLKKKERIYSLYITDKLLTKN